MKSTILKMILMAILAIVLVTPVAVFAQDTTSIGSATSADFLSTIWAALSKYIPSWVSTVLECAVVVLPAVQYVLKRIPTAMSMRIGGVIGKILNLITFFQKDNKTDGTTHA